MAPHRQADVIRGLVARLDDGHTGGARAEMVEARLARLEKAMAAGAVGAG